MSLNPPSATPLYHGRVIKLYITKPLRDLRKLASLSMSENPRGLIASPDFATENIVFPALFLLIP